MFVEYFITKPNENRRNIGYAVWRGKNVSVFENLPASGSECRMLVPIIAGDSYE